jgi:hypothetical protein
MTRPSDILALAAAETAEELMSQSEFVLADEVPIDTELTKAAKSLAYTGKITCRNEARALSIAACKLAGLSDRETAKKLGCSRNTIAPVVALLERTGKLLGLQQRLSDKLGRVAEASADELNGLIGDGIWNLDRSNAVKALAVAAGVATEKYLLLNGQATAIVEQRLGATPADQVAEWDAKLRHVFGSVIDIEAAPVQPAPVSLPAPVIPSPDT